MPVDLAPELLEILACPNCHSALAVDDEREELVCVASDCGLAYPVVDGIPVMLVDEARRPGVPGDPGDSTANTPAETADVPDDDSLEGFDGEVEDTEGSTGSDTAGPNTSGQ
jgi:uncharacterized protein YbaR (Trm112 family)